MCNTQGELSLDRPHVTHGGAPHNNGNSAHTPTYSPPSGDHSTPGQAKAHVLRKIYLTMLVFTDCDD
jgi:hypothetical protein